MAQKVLKTMTFGQLKEVLKKHLLWIDSEGGKGERAALSFAKLAGVDLKEANLVKADLKGADLKGVNLCGTNLEWADLTEANLEERRQGTGTYCLTQGISCSICNKSQTNQRSQ